jgi:hypothetical protein
VARTATDQMRAILQRYDELKQRLGYPGDFGERAFRGWLVMDLLMPVFGWPSERIVFGEVYDLILLSRARLPVITIETKVPRHRPTALDVSKFEGRLFHYATLEYAFFTDGTEVRRLHLAAPEGDQLVLEDVSIAVSKSVDFERVMAPLAAALY